ncbi:unnamed protein product [Triticum turgidum subsp. durum]|uniref:KIB1-4 beta-propeller domain-containing protein n=1 Tax=Triticum turgidum subsp. durum TaxID=4567 RepID=A0A9R1QX28_TRITD|nr:unnamed protein product [Triticum turgidum subsp. durum]
MASSEKRRASTSPSATALAPTTNPASSSPYFLPELIPLVASRLTTLEDFFALRAACRAYRDLLPPSPANLASQGPLLLFPRMASASGALFHVPLRRILRFRLPCTDLRSTEFHSFGCRVAIQDRRRELRIRHLLTGERARLPDPPEPCYSEEVVFSADLVVTCRQWGRVLYYCHIGDARWRAAPCDEGHQIYNMMFVKGTLYVLIYPHYRLAVVELDKNSVVLSFLGDKLSVPEVNIFPGPMLWLAECRGELLLIVEVQFLPCVYHVFYLQSGEGKWARTTSLGGCSLFFNLDKFAGCLGPDHPAVRRDCLYFTGCSGKWSEYSLADGSYHEFVIDHPGRTEDYGSPVWVLPSIC